MEKLKEREKLRVTVEEAEAHTGLQRREEGSDENYEQPEPPESRISPRTSQMQSKVSNLQSRFTSPLQLILHFTTALYSTLDF